MSADDIPFGAFMDAFVRRLQLVHPKASIFDLIHDVQDDLMGPQERTPEEEMEVVDIGRDEHQDRYFNRGTVADFDRSSIKSNGGSTKHTG